MKHIQKILAALVALTMAMLLALPAFAAEVSVNNNGPTDHTYTAYQVFGGTMSGDTLTAVTWGTGITADTFVDKLKTDTTVVDSATSATLASLFTGVAYTSEADKAAAAAAIAKILGDNNTNTVLANRVAELAYASKTGTGVAISTETTELADGYYLIVDTTTDLPAGQAYNKALLQVSGSSITIANKTDAPSVIKKVQDNNTAQDWQDEADYNTGDTVPFRVVGTVPDMSSFDKYYYAFNDTMTHLTYVANSAKVTYVAAATGVTKESLAKSTTAITGTTVTDKFSITYTEGTKKLEIKPNTTDNDLKTVTGVTGPGFLVVEYTATLDADAVTNGVVAGVSGSALTDIGNPNKVNLTYSANPNETGTGTTKTTPDDEVVVYSFKANVYKYHMDGTTAKALTGAKFAVFNDETKATEAITGNSYTEALTFTASGSTYTKAAATATGAVRELAVDTNGALVLNGLDAGTYYLVEAVAPSGYNKLTSAISVTITATYVNKDSHAVTSNDQLKTVAIAQYATKTIGDSSVTGILVENHKGATLPSTGGMGTTLFTILGLVLMGGAGVLLVAKRRANK